MVKIYECPQSENPLAWMFEIFCETVIVIVGLRTLRQSAYNHILQIDRTIFTSSQVHYFVVKSKSLFALATVTCIVLAFSLISTQKVE